MAGSPFPVNGVIGIVANNIDELRQANEAGLSSIEVRADLLKAGLSVPDLLSLVSKRGPRFKRFVYLASSEPWRCIRR